jgi:quercetin dioxygenase-like cupin family protein
MQLATIPSAASAALTPASESRAVVALGKNQGELVWFFDQLVVVKLRGPDAPYGVIETELEADRGTPFHRHTDEDEAFYVLEGELLLFLEGGRRLTARAGDYVHLPRGTAHGFRTLARTRMLVLSDPMGFVDFTRECGVPAERPEPPPPAQPDMSRIGPIAQKYRIDILGPLPE